MKDWVATDLPIKLLESGFILFATMMLARYLPAWLGRLGGRIVEKTESKLDDRLLGLSIAPLGKLIWLIGLYVAIRQLELPERAAFVINGVLFVIGVVVLMLLLYRLLHVALDWYVARLGAERGLELRKAFVPLLEKLLVIGVTLFGTILLLHHFHYDIWSLVTALGVGSLAIGLAAKDTLASMIAGFTIMVDRPFRQGDWITLSDGTTGKVLDVGIRSTKIRTLDHSVLIIPNGSLAISNVINHAYPSPSLVGSISVGVAYGTDIERAKGLMAEVARLIPGVLQEPAPIVYFTDFGDSALMLRLKFRVGRFEDRWEAEDAIRCGIKKKFEEAGIEIPFPIRTVYLKRGE